MDQETTANAGTSRRKYRKSALTRQRIYDEAMALMSECGFQGTTIRAVCERAEVSVGTFYNYFNSKTDILHDIYYNADELFRLNVASEIKGMDPRDQLRHFASRYARLNTDTGLDIMRVLFNPENTWFYKRRPMQDVLKNIIDDGRRKGVFFTDRSSDDLVDDIFGIFRGVCYSWCVSSAAFDLADRMGHMVELVLHGIEVK